MASVLHPDLPENGLIGASGAGKSTLARTWPAPPSAAPCWSFTA
jgi:guanylate kinase